jgi:hypothetical protein
MIEESKDGYVLGDYLPPMTGPAAEKRIRDIRAAIKRKKFTPAQLLAHAEACERYVKESSENGRAFLMSDAGLVWSSALQARTIREDLAHG